MFLTNVQFGIKGKRSRDFLEDLIQEYMSTLFHNGQLCGEYFFTWTNKILNAHAMLSHPKAFEKKYHSEWGEKALGKIVKIFGSEPKWTMLDDDIPKRLPTLTNAPFLYLFTSAFRWEPSIRRGDNGKHISTIILPITFKDRECIYHWERTYREYDNIWLGCGELEIPVYKQLADPKSELSKEGHEICESIEKSTGIPTYYYLMRYWGRKKNESNRKCPICGNAWNITSPTPNKTKFWIFNFMCSKCRLVSHEADTCDDERRARVGEYKI